MFVMVRSYLDTSEKDIRIHVDTNLGGASGRNFSVSEMLSTSLVESHFDVIWKHMGDKMKLALKEAGY
jgi:hypothetical protein